MATSARLEELQQKFRDNPRRYFAPLANEHRKLGDLQEAITLCRTHLPQQPQHVSGHIVLGQALFDAGEVSDARGSFEQALDLDPENLIALRFLGDIALARGEHLTACQWYQRVLDADPRNDEIATLIRDLEQGEAIPAAVPPSEEESTDAEQAHDEALPVATVPNETETEEPSAAEPAAHEPVEDLATAWQHEVAELDIASIGPSFEPARSDAEPASMVTDGAEPELELESEFHVQFEPEAAPDREPVVEPEHEVSQAIGREPEPEPVLPAMETAEATAGDGGPSEEPNEPWLEPDEQFVATRPAAELAESTAPPPFAEIDYSMFEAVADEEGVAAAMPVDSVDAQRDAESFEPPTPSSDDWFAAPNLHGPDVASAEPPSETAFDLDAAFQRVLPNVPEFAVEPDSNVDESSTDLPAFVDVPAEAMNGEWLSAATEAPHADDGAFSTVDGTDNVDDAFAELDRLTASMESDISASTMLLPDEQYAPAESPPQHAEALIGRTPELGVPSIEEEVPSAFVTETMAELYLQQGFREEALAVYRQLLSMSPDDDVLMARVRALDGTPPAIIEAPAADLDAFRLAPATRADAAGQSVRSFLGVFARRRAPMRRRERVTAQDPAPQRDSALAALFGSPQHGDESSAAVLAAAFAVPNAESESLPGRPTRAAAQELSLGEVFGGGAGGGAPQAASFDEFFSTGSADSATPSPLDEEGSDMVQFTAWLEGLKKK